MGRAIRGLVAVALCVAILAPSAAWGRNRDYVSRKKDPKGDEVLAASKQKGRMVFFVSVPSWQPVFFVSSLFSQFHRSVRPVGVPANLGRQVQPRDGQ